MVEYRNILFCTDFSEDANIAFMHALHLAKKYGAKLHILHVPHSPFTYSRNIVDEHVPEEKSQNGQAFFDEDVAKKAEEDLRAAYEKRLGDFKDLSEEARPERVVGAGLSEAVWRFRDDHRQAARFERGACPVRCTGKRGYGDRRQLGRTDHHAFRQRSTKR